MKAPIDSAKIMEMWLTGDMSEYMHQMQGGMWITGRQWCDFLMYVPDLAACSKDLFVRRVQRDDAFIDDMVVHLAKFDGMVKTNMQLLRDGAPLDAPTALAPATPPATPAADWRTAFLKTAS